MGWQDLLQDAPQERVLPWVGGRRLVDRDRTFALEGKLPKEHGWHRFQIGGTRRASWAGPADPDPCFDEGRSTELGYLVGDRLIPDGAAVGLDPAKLIEQTLKVHLVDRGLERFSRGLVARDPGGPWIFVRQEFPLGPEHEVQAAFVDGRPDTSGIRDVSPALELGFRFCVWQREEVVRRREEAERRRLEAEAAAAEAERLAALAVRNREQAERLAAYRAAARRGRGAGDRFGRAAAAALQVSGAELLDHRPGYNRGEQIVQFRFRHRRFECVVDAGSLRIIDSGICLIDHATGVRGDTRFTLESLPAVIDQAIREDRLVIFRHVE